MSFDNTAVRKHLQAFDIKGLFTQELGWDNHFQRLTISVEGHTYQLDGVAQKREIVAFVCAPDSEGRIPTYRLRRKIEAQVTKTAYEHFIIYIDRQQEQIWQWILREKGKSTVPREVPYYLNTSGDLLIQKLRVIKAELDEEEALTLTGQAEKNRLAFNVETVTQNFYRGFKTEHAQFVAAIEAKTLPDADREWYASVMLNRLMFLYFIQRKEFLDGDGWYLQNRLRRVREEHGQDKFYTFYRYFLMRLFHEGLGQPKHDPELQRLIGKVPYLNGGLFAEHVIERKCREQGIEIQIPDSVFESIFKFFQGFDWHLDNRKNKQGNEINPDVLGYIFEKYINFNEAGQKENGAYYTKEDITEYISRNTTLPHLLDKAKAEYGKVFEGRNSIWSLLRKDPERYIFPAMKHGRDQSLPPNIEAGIDDITKRVDWNKPAPASHALPTEIWREVVARRQRCEEICVKLAKGEVASANDLITYNLDIQQFMTDCITDYDDPQLLRALWQAIRSVRILDPTVGSGAFLFAALNILEPLYERCLERMEAYVGDKVREGGMTWAGEFAFVNEVSAQQVFIEEEERDADYALEFQEELKRVNSPEHPNRPYFIFKSIIVNNLFGVDIMEEATEICKLRLFLKLVAQVEPDTTKWNMGVEPLPDVDFNIRAGNTLVGYVNEDDMDRLWTATGQLQLDRDPELADKLREYRYLMADFQRQQLDPSLPKTVTKDHVERAARIIRDGENPVKPGNAKSNPSLNNDLWNLYKTAGKLAKNVSQSAFNETHTPLHWFVEFPEVMADGGFDVIIGNPPYVEYSKVKKDYQIFGYQTESTGNLYAYVTEQVVGLLQKHGRLGVIIPVASVCTEGYSSLQQQLRVTGNLVISNFNDRPSKLFDNLEHIRLSIILLERNENAVRTIHTSRYNRWQSVERPSLFQKISFGQATEFEVSGSILKVASELEQSILQKVLSQRLTIESYAEKSGPYSIYYTRKLSGFVQILDFVPIILDAHGQRREPSELKNIPFGDEVSRDSFLTVLNSNLFYWFLTVYSDCRNLNKRELYSISFDMNRASTLTTQALSSLARLLMADFTRSAKMLEMNYKQLGKMTIQCIYPKHSKIIIDEIDRVLARHYGFTDEELDFIINYDIKYRLGRGGDDENE